MRKEKKKTNKQKTTKTQFECQYKKGQKFEQITTKEYCGERYETTHVGAVLVSAFIGSLITSFVWWARFINSVNNDTTIVFVIIFPILIGFVIFIIRGVFNNKYKKVVTLEPIEER